MGYVCTNCGNVEKFYQEEYGSCHYEVKNLIDNEGDQIDTFGGYDYDDYDTDCNENETCFYCESNAVTWMEDDEYEEWKEERREASKPQSWKSRFEKKKS